MKSRTAVYRIVLCLVVYILDSNFRHIETIRRWRGEFGTSPPFPIDDDTLVVGYSLWAEMTCFMQLGWRFPKHVYDLHTAYLSVSNILLPYNPDEKRIKQRKGLSYACCAYGIEGWEKIDKPEMARAIGEGRWREYGQPAVFDYCEEDVRNSAELLRRQLSGHRHFAPIDPQLVMDWSEYSAKTVARIQARGMPIDMPLWNLVQENKWAVIAALIARFDPSQGGENPIYTPEGEFSSWRFEQWLVAAGITYWPRLESGALQLDGDAFRMMYHAHPAIEGLHALRDSLGVIVRARIPIGPDGRNRPSLFPFATATSRNAQAKSLYNAHASMRSFMKFPARQDRALSRLANPGSRHCRGAQRRRATGGGLSGRRHLSRLGADVRPHQSGRQKLEGDAGRQVAAPAHEGAAARHQLRHGRDEPVTRPRPAPDDRQRSHHPASAALPDVLGLARRAWCERAMLERVIVSEFDGWPLHISTSPNKRTLYNFPMQSGGAEMLRLAANRLCDAGLVPSMLVHDGILFELDNEEQVEHAIEIMRIAGTEVCGGLEIGVDEDQKLIGGARYRDKRPVAERMWQTVMEVLEQIGALPKAAKW